MPGIEDKNEDAHENTRTFPTSIGRCDTSSYTSFLRRSAQHTTLKVEMPWGVRGQQTKQEKQNDQTK